MTLELVKLAQTRISNYINKTPVLTSGTLDKLCGREIFLKCELFQKSGSFKARGALNAVLKLKETTKKCNGVITHSTGNHGQALAWAAKVVDLPCSVVVPNDTPRVKYEAIKSYGADLIFCEPTPQGRESTCNKVAIEKEQVFIPPYDHYDVIAGQGTIALELLEQVPDLDAILVPISGGGMISGIAIATKGVRPQTKVFAVEPFGKELEPCLKEKKRLWHDPPSFINTIGDGIRTQQLGKLTFPIVCEHVENKVFTVTDDQMIEAMKFIMQRMKLVVEPSSAAGVAAVMSKEFDAMGPEIKRVCVILCGGNVDVEKLPWMLQ